MSMDVYRTASTKETKPKYYVLVFADYRKKIIELNTYAEALQQVEVHVSEGVRSSDIRVFYGYMAEPVVETVIKTTTTWKT